MYLISHYDEYGSEDMKPFDHQNPVEAYWAYVEKIWPGADREEDPDLEELQDLLAYAKTQSGRPVGIGDGWGGCQFHYIEDPQ